MQLNRLLAVSLAAVAAALPLAGGAAEDWPSEPIRLVVPTTAGGGADIMSRLIAEHMSKRLGQQVVVDNRPGAGNVVGSDIVAKAEPDGHTILMTYTDHVFNPSLHASLPFDPLEDFVGVTRVATIPLLVSVNPDLPVNNVEELIEYARANPGELNFGSAGFGTSLHLAGELFKNLADIEMVHIPYKGSSPAFIDLISGQVQVMFPTALSVRPHVESGDIRAIASTGKVRTPAAPDLPTVAESGLPDYEASIWYAVLAPAGTPKEIVNRLNAEFHAVLDMPEVRNTLAERGSEVETSTPEELDKFIRDELEKWTRVIKEADLKPIQ